MMVELYIVVKKMLTILLVAFFIFFNLHFFVQEKSSNQYYQGRLTRQAFDKIESQLLGVLINLHSGIYRSMLAYYHQYLLEKPFSRTQVDILQYHHLALLNFDPSRPKNWQALLDMVDVVSPFLVVAQSKAMAQQGFSNKAGNMFGFLCYEPGCGQSKPNSQLQHELKLYQYLVVRRYTDINNEVMNYIWIINSNKAYKKFRAWRRERRHRGLSLIDWQNRQLLALTAPKLAWTSSVSFIIKQNNFPDRNVGVNY